jgi:hypothetical protein
VLGCEPLPARLHGYWRYFVCSVIGRQRDMKNQLHRPM